jgi:phospholipid/cholesterol/gamma-HCH transport system substrate-binding protein
MERDAKYAAVAAFAMLAIAAAFAFVWWYSDRGERREFVRYEIYFDGSVSGLARASPVRYLGVDVGRVRSLSIARDNPSRVRVTAEVDSETPISGATRARLGLLGLTGLLFIDLQQDPEGDPTRVLGDGQRYPIIPSRKGDIEAFVERLPDLLGDTARLVKRVEGLLTDENIKAVSTTLANVEAASRDLPAVTRSAAELAAELRRTSAEASALTQKVRAIADTSGPQVEASLASVRATAEKMSRTADSLERIVAGNEASLAQFAGSGVADLQALAVDLRGTSDEVRALARSLRDRPSSLLIEQKESGMEIPP